MAASSVAPPGGFLTREGGSDGPHDCADLDALGTSQIFEDREQILIGPFIYASEQWLDSQQDIFCTFEGRFRFIMNEQIRLVGR